MADVAVTAANVKLAASGVTYAVYQAGEAITQGQTFYKKAADNKHYKADVDASSAAATIVGIALTPAALDGYFIGATAGTINVGATLTDATVYVGSDTAGGIKPVADLASGDYVSILGVGDASGNLILKIDNTGQDTP